MIKEQVHSICKRWMKQNEESGLTHKLYMVINHDVLEGEGTTKGLTHALKKCTDYYSDYLMSGIYGIGEWMHIHRYEGKHVFARSIEGTKDADFFQLIEESSGSQQFEAVCTEVLGASLATLCRRHNDATDELLGMMDENNVQDTNRLSSLQDYYIVMLQWSDEDFRNVDAKGINVRVHLENVLHGIAGKDA